MSMAARPLPPTSGRFVKGRSGNPLGRPKMLTDKEMLLLAIAFMDLLAKAYYQKGQSSRKVHKIGKILHEK